MNNPFINKINNPFINNPFLINQIVYTPYNSEINQKPKDETEDEDVMDYVRELLRSDYTPHPAVTSEPEDETKDDFVETPTATTSETDVITPVQKQEDVTDDIFGKFGNSITHFEGSRLNAYRDAHGWAIGRGHFLGEDPSYSNMTITQKQADKYFEEDSKNIRKTLNDLLNRNPEKAKSIDDVRYNILFDLGYNGGTGLLTSLFNNWDGSEESMESLLNKYATTSKAKDYARKIEEEKGLRTRANARVAAWKKTVNNKNQNWRTKVVKLGGKVGYYQRQYDLSWNPFE